MLLLYTTPGCTSCRKARAWLKEHNIEFVEKNIFKHKLTADEVKILLMRSDNGTEDLISFRSKIIQEQKIDVDNLKLDDLIDFIIKNPSILKRPIIINEFNFQVGYDSEEIDAFLPKELRNMSFMRSQ